MYRILIVEDRPDFRRTLSGMLTDQGHVVCCAANEAEALASIAQGSFDFVLVDVRLHGEAEDDESGLSLAVALRALKPEILVILLARATYVPTRSYGRCDITAFSISSTRGALTGMSKLQRQLQINRLESFLIPAALGCSRILLNTSTRKICARFVLTWG